MVGGDEDKAVSFTPDAGIMTLSESSGALFYRYFSGFLIL
jgi:hypothetical protein